jgi:hypothetical protein
LGPVRGQYFEPTRNGYRPIALASLVGRLAVAHGSQSDVKARGGQRPRRGCPPRASKSRGKGLWASDLRVDAKPTAICHRTAIDLPWQRALLTAATATTP